VIEVNVNFFDEFKDPYLQTGEGKGIFLAGVTLGMLARNQVGKGTSLDSSPLYKQIRFGKMQRRQLMIHLSRVPELARVTLIEGSAGLAGMIEALCAKAGEFMLLGGDAEMGVNGNFAFSVAFLNAPDYFFGQIFKKKDGGQNTDADENSQTQ
jgi:hypothetical protein